MDVTKRKEVILKKRRSIYDRHAIAVAHGQDNHAKRFKGDNKGRKGKIWLRANQLVGSHKKAETATRRMVVARKYAAMPQTKKPEMTGEVLLVHRVGNSKAPAKCAKLLEKMGLKTADVGVLMLDNEKTQLTLTTLTGLVKARRATKDEIEFLVHARAYGRVAGNRLPLSDNATVERWLGKYDVLCLEDIVDQLAGPGAHFKEVNDFLWPFHLEEMHAESKKAMNKVESMPNIGKKTKRGDKAPKKRKASSASAAAPQPAAPAAAPKPAKKATPSKAEKQATPTKKATPTKPAAAAAAAAPAQPSPALSSAKKKKKAKPASPAAKAVKATPPTAASPAASGASPKTGKKAKKANKMKQ